MEDDLNKKMKNYKSEREREAKKNKENDIPGKI